MDGDIERLPLRHVDHPRVRGMELRSSCDTTPEQDDLQSVTEAFEKLRANEPETVLDTTVRVLQPCGRVAVGLTVMGTHTELHARANEWVMLLGSEESSVGYEWSIDH